MMIIIPVRESRNSVFPLYGRVSCVRDTQNNDFKLHEYILCDASSVKEKGLQFPHIL